MHAVDYQSVTSDIWRMYIFCAIFLAKIGIWQKILFTFATTDLCVCENLGKNGLESAIFEQKFGRFSPVVSRFAVLAGIF